MVAGRVRRRVGPGRGATAAAASTAPALGAGHAGRTLVVVELGGGNDGLNTVVPHADPAYRRLRPTLGVNDPIDLDGQVGFDPNLAKLAARYRAGQVAIVEGIGYPDPDLSHFASMAVLVERGSRAADVSTGWLGRYLDGTVGFDDPLAGVVIGTGPSPALLGDHSFATTIADTTGLQPRLPAWVDRPADLVRGVVPVRTGRPSPRGRSSARWSRRSASPARPGPGSPATSRATRHLPVPGQAVARRPWPATSRPAPRSPRT